MTDQSLRDALEDLLKQRAVKGKGTVANSQLRDLLAAHPVEPATGAQWCLSMAVHGEHDGCLGVESVPGTTNVVIPGYLAASVGVSDEAVDKAARLLFDAEWREGDWYWEQYPEPNRWQMLARQILDASAPLLGTRPQPTKCENCEATTFACTACGARLEEY